MTISENKIFYNVNNVEIIRIIKDLKSKTSTDYWDLSTKLIKLISKEISLPLTRIINDSLDSGSFPDTLKLAKVIPLFKKGDSHDAANYRPISLLPVFSKILEKIMYIRLEKFVTDNNIINNKQFGFRKRLSTIDAIADMTKHILKYIDAKYNTYGIFCDLSKAFDCVNHEILLSKLELYGIKGNDLLLCRSYLSARKQVVEIDGTKSKEEFIRCGVPQGSILGPLFFLIYVNDISICVADDVDLYMFADDISLLIHATKKVNIIPKINKAIQDISSWFECNNLQLNISKTNLVNFSLNVNMIGNDQDLSIRPINCVTFLGLKLDNKLMWDKHIDSLAGKLSSACYAIKKIKELCGPDAAKTVYFSYFHSIMTYGILVWGNAANSNRIFILQKRAVRYILGLKPRDTCRNAFSHLGIMSFTSAYIFQCLLYLKKNINNFPTLNSSHSYQTRHGGNIRHPTCRLAKMTKSFLCNGVKLYNKLDKELREMNGDMFKRKLKSILTKKSYYNMSQALNDDFIA